MIYRTLRNIQTLGKIREDSTSSYNNNTPSILIKNYKERNNSIDLNQISFQQGKKQSLSAAHKLLSL